jgi:hypothetical protein
MDDCTDELESSLIQLILVWNSCYFLQFAICQSTVWFRIIGSSTEMGGCFRELVLPAEKVDRG